jgi:hypothetical protein
MVLGGTVFGEFLQSAKLVTRCGARYTIMFRISKGTQNQATVGLMCIRSCDSLL